jgi:hypothetical protein
MRAPILAILGCVALTACASSTEAPVISDDSAAVSGDKSSNCVFRASDEEFAKAKAGAEARFRGRVCAEDGATIWEITEHAFAAAQSCDRYQGIIASKDQGALIRDALKGNLSLAVITGQVKVIRGTVNFVDIKLTGLEAALEGVTLYGPSMGAFGHTKKVTFAKDGKATLSEAELENVEDIVWRDKPMSWSVDADGVIKLTLDGTSVTFRPRRVGPDETPVFEFQAPSPEVPFPVFSLTTTPGECDA